MRACTRERSAIVAVQLDRLYLCSQVNLIDELMYLSLTGTFQAAVMQLPQMVATAFLAHTLAPCPCVRPQIQAE
jgi:hypothetical protein